MLTKRDLIRTLTHDWPLGRLVALARRIVMEVDVPPGQLGAMVTEYDRSGGGVGGSVKNLIFSANGPSRSWCFATR